MRSRWWATSLRSLARAGLRLHVSSTASSTASAFGSTASTALISSGSSLAQDIRSRDLLDNVCTGIRSAGGGDVSQPGEVKVASCTKIRSRSSISDCI